MVFSSILFLFRFLPVFLAVYFAVPKRMKNFILFFASLVFYAWGEPVYVGLMLFSTLSDYIHGRAIENARLKGEGRRAFWILISSLVINLGLLGFFKYADFLIGILNRLTGAALPFLKLPLPIGISFYTFQTMSYSIDVYRGKVRAQKDLLAFGTFVSMFPQLIAGPIVRYETVEKQLLDRSVTPEGLETGIRRFVLGLSKKVLLANQIGQVWDRISAMDYGTLPAGLAWIGIAAFAFQIYFDFSGYSDMAIGLGRMMGFAFPENFRYPYLAVSVTDFWRRWHISLGSWFREYVYIPLGGNRKGPARQLAAIVIVWTLTGIWHGADFNFLYWGLWFAFFLILEKLVLLRLLSRLPKGVGWLYTMVIVLFGWVIFAVQDREAIGAYLGAMLGLGGRAWAGPGFWEALAGKIGLWVILVLASTPLAAMSCRRIMKCARRGCAAEKNRGISEDTSAGTQGCGPFPVAGIWPAQLAEAVMLAVLFLLSVAFLVDATYNPFLYFRF